MSRQLLLLSRVIAILMLFSVSHSSFALAGCTITNLGDYAASSNTFSVGANLAVGGVIGEVVIHHPQRIFAKCSKGSYTSTSELRGSTYDRNTVNTSLAGVGMRFVNNEYTWPGSIFSNTCSNLFGCQLSSYNQDVRVQLIKTGPIAGGTTEGVNLAWAILAKDGYKMVYNYVGAKPQTIRLRTCDVANDVTIPLGKVDKSTFKGPGTTGGSAQTQSLGLNCPLAVNATMTISGSNDPNVGAAALATSGGAKGVGVRLKVRGADVRVNTTIGLGTLYAGYNTIPITAQYVQTSKDISPGQANASATLNMSFN